MLLMLLIVVCEKYSDVVSSGHNVNRSVVPVVHHVFSSLISLLPGKVEIEVKVSKVNRKKIDIKCYFDTIQLVESQPDLFFFLMTANSQ